MKRKVTVTIMGDIMSKPIIRYKTNDELDEILERVYLYGMNGGLGYKKFENELSPKEAKALITQREQKARYDELTKLGSLYNGSRKRYLDHYEERYKYLKTQLQSNQQGEKSER